MPLSNEQLERLAASLNEALSVVLYAYDNKVVVDEEVILRLRNVNSLADQLLAE